MKDAIERLPKPPDIDIVTGVVSSFEGGELVVIIGEDPVVVDRLTAYVPVAGDIVIVLIANGAITVLGAIA